MKNIKTFAFYFFLILVLFYSSNAFSQILTVDFETDGEGTSYRSNFFNDGSGDVWTRWDISTNPAGPNPSGTTSGRNFFQAYSGFQGSFAFGGEDVDATDNPLGTGNPSFLMLKTLDVSSYQGNNIEVKILLGASTELNSRYETGDYFRISYAFDSDIATGANSIDGLPSIANVGSGSYTIGLAYLGGVSGAASNLTKDADLDGTPDVSGNQLGVVLEEDQFTFAVPGSASNLSIRVEAFGGTAEEYVFDNIRVSTSCSAPSSQATSIVFGSETATTINLNSFTAPIGGANGYAIYMNDTNSFTTPSDGDEPVADITWNNSGQQAIYFGTSTSPNITISDLTAGDTYYFQIYAYNDCSGTETYETTGLNASDTTNSSLTWNGNSSNDWSTASNWTPATIPGSGTDVTIPTGLTNYPTASGGVTVNTVLMATGTSLIANSTFTGAVTYNRNLATTNWYLVSSPVSGETFDDTYIGANDIDTNGFNRAIATYNTTGDSWSFLQSGGSINASNGVGYSFKRATSSGEVSFTGTLNTSDINLAMVTGGNGSFNLMGNPFSSYVNINALLTANSSNLVSQDIWVWNQSQEIYEVKNLADSFMLAPAQGFFVSAANTNNFTFAQSNQSHLGSDTFQKNSRPEIHLWMRNGTTKRYTKVYYITGTTTGYDNGYDGATFSGQSNSLNVFTHLVSDSDGTSYQTQSLPNNNFENMIIPVGIISDAGSVTFSADVKNLPAGYKVFLEDKQTGNFIPLDDTTRYDVTFDAAVNGIGRFFLHMNTNTLSTDNNALENVSTYISNSNNLRIVGIQNGKTQVSLFNILGKQVVITSFEANGVNDIALPNVKQGVYLVQIVTKNGTIKKKIVIE